MTDASKTARLAARTEWSMRPVLDEDSYTLAGPGGATLITGLLKIFTYLFSTHSGYASELRQDQRNCCNVD